MPAPSSPSFGDLFDLASPFGAASLLAAAPRAGAPPTNTDYLPIVRVNSDYAAVNALVGPLGVKGFSNPVRLSASFDPRERAYQAPAIVVAKSSQALLPLRIDLGFDPIGVQDGDGRLAFRCSESSVQMQFLDEADPTDVASGTSRYNLQKTGIGDEFTLALTHRLARGTRFTITITASDDKGLFEQHSSKQVVCGVLHLQVLARDVFFAADAQLAQDEMGYLSKFIHRIPMRQREPAEYQCNYCMQGTERSLGEMLRNRTDFYSVDRNHKRRSHINMSGLTGADRAQVFNRLGYLKPAFLFDGYSINFKNLYSMVGDPEGGYEANSLNVIGLKNTQPLVDYFKATALPYQGWHVYYVTLSDNYHTLLLFIDNTNPKDPQYAFWDDDEGKTPSAGPFAELAEGFRHQTSWLFASNFRSMGHREGHYPKHISRIWKVQRSATG